VVQATYMTTKTHHGSCHCGAVRFEVELDLSRASRCNCSVCTKTAWTGAIVKPGAFKLVAGENATTSYEWGHKVSKRHFCSTCGVQCFAFGHLEVLGGDYVSINVSTLEDVEVQMLPLDHFDGRHNNWMAGTRETPWPILPAGAA